MEYSCSCPTVTWSVLYSYVISAHYLPCLNLELVSLPRSCLSQQAASCARSIYKYFLLQIQNAAHALHGRGANFAFGHSCELESPMLKAGCWRLDLRRLGRRAAESEPRVRGARGLGFKLDLQQVSTCSCALILSTSLMLLMQLPDRQTVIWSVLHGA